MPFVSAWIKRLVPKNLAGIIGVAQAMIPLVRELIIVVIRILAIVVPGKMSEDAVQSTSAFFKALEDGVNNAKNVLLT